MYEVLFYYDKKGNAPVEQFIEATPIKVRQKVLAWVGLLEDKGASFKRPYADKVEGKLYELRIRMASNNIRILYFFTFERK